MANAHPTSLVTADLASGQALARQLASQLPLGSVTDDSMAAHLRTSGDRGLDPELATAIYFHAISLANQGWKPADGR